VVGVIRKFLKLLLPFAVALPLGLALGRRDFDEAPAAVPASAASPARSERVNREPLDLQQLLRDFEAEQQAWNDKDLDPMADLLAEWTEDELKAALEEALTLPRCLITLGRERYLPSKLIGAWVKKNPDAVAAWIEGIRSSAIKDAMVHGALNNWPRDRAMEGIEFLLTHHWDPGTSYGIHFIPGVLEDKAREGAGEMSRLLHRLNEAKVGISIESLDLPVGFDYIELIGSDGFQANEEEFFKGVVFSEWQDHQPRELLAWMQETGEWKRFDDFLDPSRPNSHAAAARFWDEAEPEVRERVLKSIQWEELDLPRIRKFVEATTDPAGQDMMIAKGIANGLNRYGKLDPVEMLELLPTAERRLNVLLQLHPYTDWRPEAKPAFGEPPVAAAVRAAIGRWGIAVPPPVVKPDPFADP
jgi:hypothetical protein